MTHVYIAAIKEETTKKEMLMRFVDKVYHGSTSQVMLQLLGSKKPAKEELQVLRDLLKKFEK